MDEEVKIRFKYHIVNSSGKEGKVGYDHIGKPITVWMKPTSKNCKNWPWTFDLYPVVAGELFGFVNQYGKVYVPVEYDAKKSKVGNNLTPEFICVSSKDCEQKDSDIIVLPREGFWGAIKPNGKNVLTHRWAAIDFEKFAENRLPVASDFGKKKQKLKWGFIDFNKDEIIVAPQFDEVTKFVNGFAKVRIGKKWSLITLEGTVLTKKFFDEIGDFSHGMAPVRIGQKWGAINQNGELTVPIKYLFGPCFDLRTKLKPFRHYWLSFDHEDFAIVVEGGELKEYCERTGFDGSGPYETFYKPINGNWKIVTKDGLEVLEGCSKIKRTGKTTYRFIKTVYGKEEEHKIQLIYRPEFIVIIEDATYEESLLKFPEGRYAVDYDPPYPTDCWKETGDIKWPDGHYIEGGLWRAIDHNGKPVTISAKEMKEVKNGLKELNKEYIYL